MNLIKLINTMTYEQFHIAINALKAFLEERKKLEAAIKVISPTSTGVVELGGQFIEDYIAVLEIAMGDKEGWIDWYVLENDFGARGLKAYVDKEYKIRNDKDMYNFLQLLPPF